MNRWLAVPLCVLAFMAVLGAQIWALWTIVPHDFTGKQVNDFLLISMGLAFIPLILLGALCVAVFLLMCFVSGIATAYCWRVLVGSQKPIRKKGM